jgi:hypothetical protein
VNPDPRMRVFAPMPRYYFHVRNGLGFTRDEEGQELPDAEAARAVAVRGVRSLITAEVADGRVDLRGRIEVTDGDGAPLFELAFADTVQLLTGDPPAS